MKVLGSLPFQTGKLNMESVTYEDIDSKLVFQLVHTNQSPLVFYADTETTPESLCNQQSNVPAFETHNRDIAHCAAESIIAIIKKSLPVPADLFVHFLLALDSITPPLILKTEKCLMGCNSSKDGIAPVIPINVPSNKSVHSSATHIILPLKGEEDELLTTDKKSNQFWDPNQQELSRNQLQESQTSNDDVTSFAAFRNHAAVEDRKSVMENTKDSITDIIPDTEAELEELTNAATKIQASFRGHMTRKHQKQTTDQEALVEELKRLDTKEGEDLNIDLGDPELNKAATKIQASFRGHKVRKEVTAEMTPPKTTNVK